MQKTVLDAFPRDRILTPRDIRGDYPSLAEAVRTSVKTQHASKTWSDGDGIGATTVNDEEEEAVAAARGEVLAGGWPKVDDSRGMVLFIIDYQSINTKCRDGVREVQKPRLYILLCVRIRVERSSRRICRFAVDGGLFPERTNTTLVL